MYSDLLFDYLKSVNIECDSESSNLVGLERLGIKKDSYQIATDEESKMYGKPKGKYELISLQDVLFYNEEDINRCVEIVAETIKDIVGVVGSSDRILVVGLGNRHISPDSLGAKVVGGINITIENNYLPKVMAICPSVMGLTGIETYEIIKGVSVRVKPTHVILIDSLCASAVERLGRSIQITNTGICPGGGIGNNRKCIGEDIADKVYSIGVPLLIYASTFIKETLDKNKLYLDEINNIMQYCKKSREEAKLLSVLNGISNMFSEDMEDMIVSIKDIDESVGILSRIISQAINIALGVSM